MLRASPRSLSSPWQEDAWDRSRRSSGTSFTAFTGTDAASFDWRIELGPRLHFRVRRGDPSGMKDSSAARAPFRRILLSLCVAVSGIHPAAASAQRVESITAGSVRVEYAPRQRAMAREVMAAARTPVRFPGMGAVSVP